MPVCYKCGGEITFWNDDGVVKPMHLSGGCWDELDNSEVSSSFTGKIATTPTNPDDYCRSTICKKCGAEIFFIRHNGGSLWVNSPLGYPWPKHPCYYDEMTTQEHTRIVTLAESTISPILGVIIYTETRPNYMSDVIVVKCFDGGEASCLVSYVKQPSNLIGKLVFLSLKEQKLVIPDAITYSILDFTINNTKPTQTQKPQQERQIIKSSKSTHSTKTSSIKFMCKLCGQAFDKKKSLRSHRFTAHLKQKPKS